MSLFLKHLKLTANNWLSKQTNVVTPEYNYLLKLETEKRKKDLSRFKKIPFIKDLISLSHINLLV